MYDVLYAQHEKMIYGFVSKTLHFAKNVGIDYDEILSEANRLFMCCVKKFDPNRHVKFGTYLHSILHFRLYSFVEKKRSKYFKQTSFEHISDESEKFDATRQSSSESTYLEDYQDTGNSEVLASREKFEEKVLFDVMLESLSRDARMCVDIAFDPPAEIKDFFSTKDNLYWKRNGNRHIIQKYLKSLGWKQSRINHAFVEINMTLLAS